MPETVRFVVDAVAKYPVPLAVMLVALAPPFIENSPLVIVDDAFNMRPLVKVARPVWVRMPVCVVFPETVSAPSVAVCENRFVDEAVVEKKLVVVPDVSERVPRVESPVTPSVPPVDMLLAENVVPFHVMAVPEVMRVPSKKLTPSVTWVDVAVPPFAIGRIPVTSAVRDTVAQVATPAPLSERTN